MDQNEKLKLFSIVVNRRLNQLTMLFDLCDQDFDKLLRLEAILKQEREFGPVPDSKELIQKLCTDILNKK